MEGQVLGTAAAVWKRAKKPTALFRKAGYFLLSLVSLATVTGLYFWLDAPTVAAAFTYLVVLVLLSLVSNLSSLVVLSFIGVCCLSYFFAPPIYSFRVDYAQDLITMSAFVITSFVVNFLVTRVRDANQRLEVTNKALRIENVERKRAEQAQRESEDKLRQIIETGPNLLWSAGSEGKKAEVQPGFMAQVQAILNVIPAHTWYASPSGGLTFVNKRTADYLGLPKDHPLRFGIDVGAQWDAHLPFVHPDDREETQENWSTRLRTGEGGEGSFRVRNAQGGYRWFLSRAEPLRAGDGTILQWVGVNLDIEEHKCAEQALRESEYKLRQIIETVPSLLWSLAPDGEPTHFNQRFLAILAGPLRTLSMAVGGHSYTRTTFQKLKRPSPTQFRPEFRAKVCSVSGGRTASIVGTRAAVILCAIDRETSSSGTACLLTSMKPRRPKTGYAAVKPIWPKHRGWVTAVCRPTMRPRFSMGRRRPTASGGLTRCRVFRASKR